MATREDCIRAIEGLIAAMENDIKFRNISELDERERLALEFQRANAIAFYNEVKETDNEAH
jgi:hypothetical protein